MFVRFRDLWFSFNIKSIPPNVVEAETSAGGKVDQYSKGAAFFRDFPERHKDVHYHRLSYLLLPEQDLLRHRHPLSTSHGKSSEQR
jgi:phage gp16-like protein